MLKKYADKLALRLNLNGWRYTIDELINQHRESTRLIADNTGVPYSSDILKWKRSDTVVIMGSGPSISEITTCQWSLIGRNFDSIGLNNSIIHNFVPTFYLYQEHANKSLTPQILMERFEELKETVILVRGSGLASGLLHKDLKLKMLQRPSTVYFIKEFAISRRNHFDLNVLYDYMAALGLFTWGSIGVALPKFGATAGLAMSFAFQMGYKNILLVGFDMKDDRHFWDLPNFSGVNGKRFLTTPFPNNLMSNRLMGFTLDESIIFLASRFLCSAGVRTELLSSDTILYPKLPLYSGAFSEQLSTQRHV